MKTGRRESEKLQEESVEEQSKPELEMKEKQLRQLSPVVEAMQKTPLLRVDLTWRGLTVWVTEKSISHWPVKGTCRRKRVLNNVSGIARSGTLTAILGPSGAGKTTLLCALANRLCGEIGGEIRINGWPVDGDMLRLSTFIPQQNLFIETLTAREHLEFMVGLRYHYYSNKERKSRVDELLKELGLQPNSRISSLSGGERKRLIFASEIVTDPPLLFCDEPTSGLDSHTAHTIISLLEQLAARGRTIICSIHQPSSKVFSAFHHLILLTEGRVAFTGRSQDAEPFFLSLGYRCPRNYNPADFYIQTLAARRETDERLQTKRIHDICDSFSGSETASHLAHIIQKFNDASFLSSYSNKDADRERDKMKRRTTMFGAKWRAQIYWLTWRSVLDSIRNPSVHMIRTVHKVVTSILIASFFAGVKLNQKGIQDIEGALFFFLTENNFPSCYAVLSVFPQEIPIFLREQSSSLYRSDAYYISKMVSLIPGFIIEPFLFTTIAYWIIGLRPDIHAFFLTALVVIMTANVACAYGCFLSAAFESVDTSFLVMMPINQLIIVSAGILINVRTIPIYLNWVKYLSWMMYSNEALTIVQWDGINSIECEASEERRKGGNGTRAMPCKQNGQEVLTSLGFESSNLYRDLIMVVLIFSILHFLAFLCIWLRSRSARSKHSTNMPTVEKAQMMDMDPSGRRRRLPGTGNRAHHQSGISHRFV